MYEDRESPQRRFFNRRLAVFAVAVTSVFLVLAIRIYYLQVVRGPFFRQLSEANRISRVRVKAPRGNIMDRFGNVLVTNRPSFSVNLVLESIGDFPGTALMAGEVLGVGVEEIERKVSRARAYRRFDPVRVGEDVSREAVALLESRKYAWPGVQIEVEPRRSYPYGSLASHLLGHVGEISLDELKARREEEYRMGDHIGKEGVERLLDAQLKGRDGFQQVEVDSLGREIRVLAGREPRPGKDVNLSLNLALQQVVEEALGEKSGAIAVIDPSTGDILAAASSPAVDPNRFIKGLSSEEWKAMEQDRRHPLQNRIFQAQYPPGSVFKIVTAIAALEKGIIDEGTTFTCRGAMTFGNRQYRCWKRGGHGEVSLHRALVESCDVYFYQVGIRTGIDHIAEYARELGLGKTTGLGLGGEVAGLVPSQEWKKKARGEPWYPGETLSVAIGQGYNLVTPLQMASLAALLANGSVLHRPRLITSVVDPEGGAGPVDFPEESRRVAVSPRNMALVKSALEGVVNEERGTGRAAAVPGLRVAGKTGTAQVVKLPRGGEGPSGEDIPEHLKDHAWFICYVATAAREGVAMAVLVEHGGHGGSASAPLAGKVLREMRNLGFLQPEALAEATTGYARREGSAEQRQVRDND